MYAIVYVEAKSNEMEFYVFRLDGIWLHLQMLNLMQYNLI